MEKDQLKNLWNQLQTSIDSHGYAVCMDDPKVSSTSKTVFIEDQDPFAIDFYKRDTKNYGQGLEVRTIPRKPNAATVSENQATPGLVASVLINNDEGVRGTPFVYLGKGYTELDVAASYFIVLGLLASDRLEMAKQQIGNITYMVGHTHSLKATNRIYHQHLPALPLYTSMVDAVAKSLSHEERPGFLKIHIMRGILDYFRNWHADDLQLIDGLNIYPKSQVDPKTLTFEIPECHLIPVRLNMMLYKTETDLAHWIENYVEGGSITVEDKTYKAPYWKDRAQSRLENMHRILWNSDSGTFNDFDSKAKVHTNLNRADFIYALWANAVSDTQLSEISNNLTKYQSDHGLIYDLGNSFGQAPEQIIAWLGLEQNGLGEKSQQLKSSWQKMVLGGYKKLGNLAMRYDLESGMAENGSEGLFGWTLASLLL